MPTLPIHEVLPRFIDDPRLRDLLTQFAAVIDETVNWGTHVLTRCADASGGMAEGDVPAVLSLRHALELADAIAILIKRSSIDPCKALLRSLFEVTPAVEYLLQSDTQRRGMAFLTVGHVHRRLKMDRRLDPTTEVGKQFRATLGKDSLVGGAVLPGFDLQSAIANLERLLTRPGYAEADAEYRRTIAGRGLKNPDWYTLYDGPKNIEALAIAVSRSGIYDTLYREWSSVTHGTDIVAGKLVKGSGPKGGATVVQIRSPRDAQQVANFTVAFLLLLFRQMMSHYDGEMLAEHGHWYEREIREHYLRLSGEPLLRIN